MTTSAIRRRYGWGAARLCIEAQPVRYEKTPPLLPNATSGAATVLIGGLAVFALLRSIEPPDETPSEIQIVQLEEMQPEPPPPPEQVLQPLPEPEPPPPEPKPEPVVVAQAPPPPPKPQPVKHKAEAPKRRELPKPKPEPVRVAQEEPPPLWKAAPITPPPAPRPEPPPARRPPPAVQIDAPKPLPAVVESPPAPAWKPVAIAQNAPKAAAPRVAIDAVRAPSSAPPELPTRAISAPPGAPSAAKPAVRMPNVRPVVPAAAAPDFAADSTAAPSYARSAAPTPVAPAVTVRPPPKGVAMPGISAARDSEPAREMDTRGYDRPGVTAPPAAAARSEPNAKLRGVPLGSLAACRTDRLEDDLKQRVLAAVRNREECASAAGRYRFVETKNLNAFLMWIERAPGRAEGDRCAELSNALSCLRGGAR
ncbi:MAG: hypothetical protein ACHQ6T_06345 [Myxococcota bacterium]